MHGSVARHFVIYFVVVSFFCLLFASHSISHSAHIIIIIFFCSTVSPPEHSSRVTNLEIRAHFCVACAWYYYFKTEDVLIISHPGTEL
jgi:hypothetical protein